MELFDLGKLLNHLPSTAVFTAVVLILSILLWKLKNRNLPPGPWGLPLVGYWPFLEDKTVHLHLQRLSRKYGDVFSINITGQLYIHLGTLKSIREAQLTRSDCFTDRTKGFAGLTCFFPEGVLATNGEKWKTLRKFFLQKFREYGFSGGKDLSESVQDAIKLTTENLNSSKGSPVNIVSVLMQHCLHVVRPIFFKDELVTDEEIEEFLENYIMVGGLFESKKLLLDGNFTKFIIMALYPSTRDGLRKYKKLDTIMGNIVKRHREALNEQNITTIVDSYYQEKNEREKKGDPTAEFFTDKALSSTLLQVIGDGILGVAAFISIFIYSLAKYPEHQEEVYKELIEVLGPDVQPTLQDRNKLPYTSAFLTEASRFSDVINIFPSLQCTKETTVGGYRIPKGAITLVDFYSSNRDPNQYDEPDKFKPSRFLKQDGKEKAEVPILFGIGKRACIGEAFVTNQTFLAVTNLVKNFKLKLVKEISKIYLADGVLEIIAIPREEK